MRALDVGRGPRRAHGRARASARVQRTWSPSSRRSRSRMLAGRGCRGSRSSRRARRRCRCPTTRSTRRFRQLVLNFLERRAAGRARDGARHAAPAASSRLRLGLRRRDGDAARVLGRGPARWSPQAPRRTTRRTMRWCREGELGRAVAGLGLLRTSARRRCASRGRYADFEDLWASFLGGRRARGGVHGRASAQDDQAALRCAGARLGAGDEPFELTARAWAVAGTVP